MKFILINTGSLSEKEFLPLIISILEEKVNKDIIFNVNIHIPIYFTFLHLFYYYNVSLFLNINKTI